MTKEFDYFNPTKIIMVGSGGAGNNTIDRISMLGGVIGAETIALNTDRQHLENIQADKKFVIGKELTKGLGAGGDPSVGWEAAQEDRHKLKDFFKDANLVFVSAGMGGGTGTGSAPVVAEVAKECGALVVGVVSLPFRMEGSHIFEKAIQGLEALRRYADTVIALDNNKLLQLVPNMPIDYAFSVSDEVLAETIKGITETITQPSLVNLDFADVRTILQDGGVAVLGVGESNTKNRVEEAVHEAMTCKLLDVDYKNAKGALVHVSGGNNMTLNEANRVGEIVNSIMDPEAKIIWGARVDEGLKDSIRIRFIMTGVKSPYISGRAADGDIGLQPFERDARRRKIGFGQMFGRSIDWTMYGIDLNELFQDISLVSKENTSSSLIDNIQDITYYDKVLENDPNNLDALVNKGNALLDKRDYEQAIYFYDKVLENDPNNLDALISKGTTFSHMRDYEQAIYFYDKVLENDPNNLDALISKGTTLYELKKYKEAIEYYDKLLGINQNIVYLPVLKGIALFDLGKYDESMGYFDKALEIDQENIYPLIVKGLALHELKRYGDAITCYNKVLRIDPNNAGVLSNKAETLIELNKLDFANEICDLLKARTDLEEDLYSKLMSLYSKLNDYPSVKEVFNKSPKTINLYETFNKIRDIKEETSEKEKQRLQGELDDANKELMAERIRKEYIEKMKFGEVIGVVREEGEEGRKHTTKEHEKTREEIQKIFHSLNEDIVTIKKNGEKALTGIHDLDQKMDKLSEISEEIYQEAKKTSEKLIEENPKKFNEKKKELLDRFKIDYKEYKEN